jgi:hypothetical protein
MPEFSVYQQQRQDNGVRIGISLDGDLCWHHFEPGTADEDPSLRWYIDVRGKGKGVPAEPVKLHQWLQSDDVARSIRKASDELADRLEAGIDHDGWPVRHRVKNLTGGMQLELVASAVRRVSSLSIREILRRFGRDWPTMLAKLEPTTQSV